MKMKENEIQSSFLDLYNKVWTKMHILLPVYHDIFQNYEYANFSAIENRIYALFSFRIYMYCEK